MLIQGRGTLSLTIIFIVSVIMAGLVYALDKPPTPPPSGKVEVSTGHPKADTPPTHPPQVNNHHSNQILENGAVDSPPPPIVEERKPVVGGPVNDTLPDPPTTKPDKKPKGIKKESANISKAAKIKEEGIHIEPAKKQQEGSLQDVMPMRTISVSPESSKGVKKETDKISMPERKLGKGQVKAVGKSLPDHSLKKKQITDGPTRSIKNTKNPDVINDKEQKGN